MNGGRGLPAPGQPFSLVGHLGELERRVENMIQYGTVEEADYEAGKVRIRIGDPKTEKASLLTDWIPWGTARACNNRHWTAPEVNEQVILFAQSGDLGQAVVLSTFNKEGYKHGAKTPEIERKIWRLRESLLDALFWQMDRSTAVSWEYLTDEGMFRREVGKDFAEGSSIIQGKDFIELRVKDTKIVIRDGAIKLHVKGDASEIKMTESKIEMHVGHKGVVVIEADQIKEVVNAAGQVLIREGMVEASVAANSVVRLTPTEINAELMAQHVRLWLAEGHLRALVQNTLLDVATSEIRAIAGQSSLTLAQIVTLLTPHFEGVEGAASVPAYVQGEVVPVVMPPAEVIPPPVPRPPLIEGENPTLPPL